MKKKVSILDSIGNTPLIELNSIYIKLEHLNPSGSIKDRIAKYIIEKAEISGMLKKGMYIVEATSGNTGIAFSLVTSVKGYKMIVVMPKGLTNERTKMILALGAKLVLVKENCVSCAIKKTHEISRRLNAYLPGQFENEWNIEENEKILGREILKQLKGKKINAFVAGVGTGGSLIGIGKALKKRFPDIKIIAMEPYECQLLSGNGYGHHKIHELHTKICHKHEIEGIGDGFIPGIIKRNRSLIDDVITIKTSDAIDATKKLAHKGYFVGISSGANYLAALRLKQKYNNVITLFPDRGDRYLTLLYKNK